MFRQLEIDLAIINALKAGDESALRTIFENHNRKMLYFAKSIVKDRGVAEEIVPDSMVKLWQKRETFETSDSINAFLYIIIRNSGINYIKASYASQQFGYHEYEVLESSDSDSHIKIVRAELLQSIYDEVDRLPERQREVFKLILFRGFEYR